MRYITTAYLSDLVRRNLFRIPHDVDLVVGVPRSGMLPATMIALALNKRLTDIDSFVEGRVFEPGYRGSLQQWGEIRKVLVVDDSVNSGMAMTKAKEQLASVAADYEITYLAVIAASSGIPFVDLFFELVDDERVFEWNLFHHYLMSEACLDVDGVLNVDPEMDDDGPLYLDFLKNAKPLHLPTVEVNTLISCRLEKYRQETEEWLHEHNVRYKNLVMLDFPDKQTRVKWGKHGEYKADYYAQSPCRLFVESSLRQARIIADKTHKPVICMETNAFVTPKKSKLKKLLKRQCPVMYARLKQIKDTLFS